MADLKNNLDEVLTAIKGSQGIKRTIADRLGVTRWTVDNYLKRWKTAEEAFNEELETPLDIAESIVIGNMIAAHRQYRAAGGAILVDSSDAKWYLTKKGKARGYGEAVDVTSGGEPIKAPVIYLPNNGRDSD
jgi:hypothetical protein